MVAGRANLATALYRGSTMLLVSMGTRILAHESFFNSAGLGYC